MSLDFRVFALVPPFYFLPGIISCQTYHFISYLDILALSISFLLVAIYFTLLASSILIPFLLILFSSFSHPLPPFPGSDDPQLTPFSGQVQPCPTPIMLILLI